MFMLARV